MAGITDLRNPFYTMEVDSVFKAAHVTVLPSWDNPRVYEFTHTATLLAHATTSYAFALRNSDPTSAKVIRYMKFTLEDGAAANPVAAIEYGMDLYLIRTWTAVAAPGALGTPPDPAARRPEMMPPSASAHQASSTMLGHDVRVPANSSSLTCIAATEQFEADTQPFMAVRGWHLIAGATVAKTVDEMEYDGRDPGLYPLVLGPNEGVGLRPAVSTWANMNLTINVQWEEVPLEELDHETRR